MKSFEEEASVAAKDTSKEGQNGKPNSAISDILEKKWVSITRLQKKVMELEGELQRLQEENN